jgi:hypothetical protein
MTANIGVPTIRALEIEALGEHFKNYTSGPGHDVLRLIASHQAKCSEIHDHVEEIARMRVDLDTIATTMSAQYDALEETARRRDTAEAHVRVLETALRRAGGQLEMRREGAAYDIIRAALAGGVR